jgi:hypothetical protein
LDRVIILFVTGRANHQLLSEGPEAEAAESIQAINRSADETNRVKRRANTTGQQHIKKTRKVFFVLLDIAHNRIRP